jgi:hypothetical protein
VSGGGRVGGPAGGVSSHGRACGCARCTGFLPGHELAVGHGRPPAHGAYSTVTVSEPAERLAAAIRPLLPVYDEVDGPALRALAVVLVRVERAEAALAQLERMVEEDGRGPLAMYAGEVRLDGKVVRVDGLKADLRGWLRVAETYFAALGMTPGSRLRLGLDLLRAKRLTVLDLHREAAFEETGEGETVEVTG